MKLHYYPETDSLYIELKATPGTEAREIAGGLVIDVDAKGEIVGLDIDFASSSPSPGATPDTSGLAPPSPTGGEGLESGVTSIFPSPLAGEGFPPRSCARELRKSHGGKGEG